MDEYSKAYLIIYSQDSSFYIPNAIHIERNDELMLVDTDEEAALVAEKDGVQLIYGMEHVPDGVYLDTPENRAVIVKELELHPEYKDVANDNPQAQEDESVSGMGMHFGKG